MTGPASLIRTLNQKRLIIALLLVATLGAWAGTPLLAQESQDPGDLTDLSLEELMELDVLSVSVLGTHTHLAGDWMIGYRFMFMRMQGNRDGTSRQSSGDVLQNFPVTPTEMNMAMHMFEVMYSPSSDLTLMAMFPYLRLSMDHLTRSGIQFTTESQGLADISFSGLYTVYGDAEKGGHRLLVIPGVSFPTGSIDQKDDTPAGHQQLPYPMQLGFGHVRPASRLRLFGRIRKLGLADRGERDGPAWKKQPRLQPGGSTSPQCLAEPPVDQSDESVGSDGGVHLGKYRWCGP